MVVYFFCLFYKKKNVHCVFCKFIRDNLTTKLTVFPTSNAKLSDSNGCYFWTIVRKHKVFMARPHCSASIRSIQESSAGISVDTFLHVNISLPLCHHLRSSVLQRGLGHQSQLKSSHCSAFWSSLWLPSICSLVSFLFFLNVLLCSSPTRNTLEIKTAEHCIWKKKST